MADVAVAKVSNSTGSKGIICNLDGGAESATAIARLKGVRQFAKWLTVEGDST